jgi:integrase/recombinase XerD
MKFTNIIIKSLDYQTYLERFEVYIIQMGYTPNTQKQMPRSLKEFLHWLENEAGGEPCIENVTSITTAHIKDFYRYLQTRPNVRNKNGLSQSHLTSILYGLRTFYHYLQANGETSYSPFDTLHFPQAKYLHREALSQEQIKQLYEACETLRDRAFLSIYYGCGLRLSEGIALKVNDINFTDGILYVREGKGKKRRAVPMSGKVANDLMSYYRLERPKVAESSFLLNNNRKAAVRDWASKRIKYLLSKAGLPSHYSLHHLRHSIATHLLENGMKIEQVGDFLGHTCLESTQIYAKVSTQHLIKNL